MGQHASVSVKTHNLWGSLFCHAWSAPLHTSSQKGKLGCTEHTCVYACQNWPGIVSTGKPMPDLTCCIIDHARVMLLLSRSAATPAVNMLCKGSSPHQEGVLHIVSWIPTYSQESLEYAKAELSILFDTHAVAHEVQHQRRMLIQVCLPAETQSCDQQHEPFWI